MDHHNNSMLDLHLKTTVIRLRKAQKPIEDVAKICGITPFEVSYIMFLVDNVVIQCMNLGMTNTLVAAVMGVTEADVATLRSNIINLFPTRFLAYKKKTVFPLPEIG